MGTTMTRNIRKAKSMSTLHRGKDDNNTMNEAKTLQEVREALHDIGRPYEARQRHGEEEERATPTDPYPQNPKRVAFRDLAARQKEAIRDSILKLPSVPTHVPIPTASKQESITEPRYRPHRFSKDPAAYTKPFCDALTENPTIFHFVDAVASELKDAGYTKLSERDAWKLEKGGKYYVERNASSLIAFSVGYVQLGVAPYAGALNSTWWDRDLGIGGRVLVKESSGKVVTKLVKLPWPIARIPTLAPHFGAAASGPFNPETQMVPIIGLEGAETHSSEQQAAEAFSQPSLLGG